MHGGYPRRIAATEIAVGARVALDSAQIIHQGTRARVAVEQVTHPREPWQRHLLSFLSDRINTSLPEHQRVLLRIMKFSPLRALLLVVTVAVSCVGPFLDGTADPHSWRIIPTVIAPAFMMILVFALPLDITMTLVFMSDTTPERRAQLKRELKLEATAMVLMLLAWTPFYVRFFTL